MSLSQRGGRCAVALVALATASALSFPTQAAAAEMPGEAAFVFNTFSFLIHGALVLWMAAGFAMLEAGLVRTKSVTTILLKNIALFSIAGIAYYLVGYRLMYDGVDGGWIGSLGVWSGDDSAALAGDYSAGYASGSDWFFQMVFVATTASIVSGALAERIKLWPFLVFVLVLAAGLYPISGAWHWGGGWLAEMGFADFAGSTLVHSVGGWAALSGAIILGARTGKYGPGGKVNAMPGSSLPLATLGTFILWMGWLGFNGGSQLALGSAADAVAMANIYVNTTMASASGVVAAMLLAQAFARKVDLTMALNGALAGLVAITAGPDTPSVGEACLIGAVGGALVIVTVPLLDRFKIDDVVGAIPVHLVAGVWGTIAVVFTNPEASLLVQLTGVAAVGGFMLATSSVLWLGLRAATGLRIGAQEEQLGIDVVETGLRAYPEFGANALRS